MEEIYDVLLAERSVGTAEVTREGLYYSIRIRCDLSGEIMCRVFVTCGDRQENLGVAVPIAGRFGLDTKISRKRLGEGKLSFRALPRHKELGGRFVPLSPEEPFRYITRLRQAYLEHQNGKIGIRIKEAGCD